MAYADLVVRTRSQKEAEREHNTRFHDADVFLDSLELKGFEWPDDDRAIMAKYAKHLPFESKCPACNSPPETDGARCKCPGPHWRPLYCKSGHHWWPCATKLIAKGSKEYVYTRIGRHEEGGFKRTIGPEAYMRYLQECAGLWLKQAKSDLKSAARLIAVNQQQMQQ